MRSENMIKDWTNGRLLEDQGPITENAQGPTQSFTGNEGPEVLESLASIPRSTLRRSEPNSMRHGR